MNRFTLHIIVNTQAGSGNAKKILATAENYLKEKNIIYTTYFTEYAGHERKIASELLDTILIDWQEDIPSFPLLVVLGGDGTLHEVINVLQDFPNIPIGYIPGGSGNDFARGVSLSRKTKEAIDRLLYAKEPQAIKMIRAWFKEQDSVRFILNNIGIGLDANIVTTANHSKTKKFLNKLHLGSLAYLAAIFKVIRRQKTFPLSLKTDKEAIHFDNAYLCSITNHPYFGGGVAIDPTASPFNDEISIVLVEKVNIFEIIYLAVRILSKTHLSSKYIHHFKTKTLEITSPSEQFAQTDGEIIGEESYTISCELTERLFWI
ncbi:MAG: diacylglycerol kinase family lipid kinase [Vagococcus sp.]|uniref:diacylglycerol/lipid kinase family protein n=1 Tax=Vagococcus sp. TaxID=1933889 RepID=UPI002FC58935